MTFQAACRVIGLLEDDAHWDKILEKPSIYDSPHKMCELFTIILIFCRVTDPINLWNKYQDNFAEGIRRRMSREQENLEFSIEIVYNQCLIHIKNIVVAMTGKTQSQFGLISSSRAKNSVIINHQ